MAKTKSIKSRVLSLVMTGVMTLAGVATSLGGFLTSPSSMIIASAGTSWAPGSGGNGNNSQYYDLYPTGVTGVRLYFAPSSIFAGYETGDFSLTKASLSKLHSYEKYAIYAVNVDNSFSDVTASVKSKSVCVREVWSDGTYYKVNKNKDVSIDPKLIISCNYGSCSGNDLNFKSLFGGLSSSVNKFSTWVSKWDNWSVTADGSSVSNWANKYFRDGDSNHSGVEYTSAFVENYYEKVKDVYPDIGTKLPKNYEEFVAKHYVLIVEDVIALKNTYGDTNYKWLTNQDLVQAVSSGTISYNPGPGNASDCMYAIAENVKATHCIFPEYSTPVKHYDYESQRETLGGYGIYTGGKSIIGGGTETKPSISVTAYNSSSTIPYKYSSVAKTAKPVALSQKHSIVFADSSAKSAVEVKKQNLTLAHMRDTGYNNGNAYKDLKFYSYATKWKGLMSNPLTVSDGELGYQYAMLFAPIGSGNGAVNNNTITGDTFKDNFYLRSVVSMRITIPKAGADKTLSPSDLTSYINNAVSTATSKYETRVKPTSLRDAKSGAVTFGNSFVGELYNESGEVASVGGSGLAGKITSELKSELPNTLGDIKVSCGTLSYDTSADKYQRIKTIVTDAGKMNNIIANANSYARAQSTVHLKNNPTNSKAKLVDLSKANSVGLSITHLIRKQDVTSRYAYVVKDKNGNLTYGDKGSTSYDILSSGSFTFDAESSGSTYVIAIPDSDTLASQGYSLSKNSNGSKLVSLFKDKNLNTVDGKSTLISVLTQKLGYSTSWVSSNNIVYSLNPSASMTVSAGAVGNVNGNDATALKGYNFIIYTDKSVTPNQSVTATLGAHEINFIYPTVLGDTSGHLITASTNGCYLEITKKAGTYGGTIIGGNVSSHPSIYFNTAMIPNTSNYAYGKFDIESKDPKMFVYPADNGGVKLNHSFNLSRSILGDKVTISSLHISNKNQFSAISDRTSFLKDTMGLTIGIKPESTSSGTSGQTSLLSTTGKDKWFWTGVTHSLSSTKTPFITGEDMNNAGYNMTEKAYKYTANNRGTAENGKAGTTSYTKANKNPGKSNYTLSSVVSYDSVLKFYPEVMMTATFPANVTAVNNTGASAVAVTTEVYVMGEKLRSLKPSGMFNMSIQSDKSDNSLHFKGSTTSSAIATGSGAEKLQNRFKDGGTRYPVIYAGADVQMTVKAGSNERAVFSGFLLDIMDADVDTNMYTNSTNKSASSVLSGVNLKETWGSGSFDSETKFTNWAGNIKKNLYIAADFQTTKSNGNPVSTYTFGTEKLFTGSNAGKVSPTLVASYNIRVANGQIVEDGAYTELLKAIKSANGLNSIDEAKQAFAQSGILESITSAMETRQSSDNGSTVVGDRSAYGNSKWYDETANYFVIRYYKAEVSLIGDKGKLIDSKLDITSGPSQSGTLFSDGYKATWYLSVGIDNSDGNVSGLSTTTYNGKDYSKLSKAVDDGTIAVYETKINGADFIIPDATTADMNK